MERKYKQRGYMADDDREKQNTRPAQPRRQSDGPRSHALPPMQQVFRCSLCGSSVIAIDEISFASKCQKCQADLHTCKNCVHFNPAARFECTQPIQERIKTKDVGNLCGSYEPRRTVERATTGIGVNGRGRSVVEKPSNGRTAFDKLFKK